MGNGMSEAKEQAEEAQKTIDAVIESFEDKRQLYLNEMSRERGPNANDKAIEVAGGRTIMEYSEIFYTEKAGANSEITDAIGSFFDAADAGIDGDDKGAQHAAVLGAKKLITAAIAAIVGETSIGVRETSSFNVIFLNNSFVRIDYKFFQQNIDVVKYISEIRSTARLIVCQLAILPIEDMQPSEITYLLSQSFDLGGFEDPNLGFAKVGKLQTNLIQLSVLTRMLQSFLAEEDKEFETEGVSVADFKNRAEALIYLSKSVDTVLNEIGTDLVVTEEELTGVSTRKPKIETRIKDDFLDARQNALVITDLLVKRQQDWLSGSEVTRENIKKKLFGIDSKTGKDGLVKRAYLQYRSEFENIIPTANISSIDAEKDEDWTESYTAWYKSHKADFAMWWFSFLKRASVTVTVTQVPTKDGKNTDGKNTDGNNTDGNNTDGKNTDGKNTDGKNTDGKNTNGKDSLPVFLSKDIVTTSPDDGLSYPWLSVILGSQYDKNDGLNPDNILKDALEKINKDKKKKKDLRSVTDLELERAINMKISFSSKKD